LVLIGLVVALVVWLGGGSSTEAGKHTNTAPAVSPGAGAQPLAPQGRIGSGSTGSLTEGGHFTEVRDPEEARSYPAPAGVQHSSASSPASAAEAIVAPGATPTSQVRKELAQMKALERASRAQTLTPVKGGDSIGGDGTIPIPTNVPEVVQRVVAGANAIADFPYRFGGGHGSFIDNAYDCSGSVSYALAAAGLLATPETSGQLESWGKPGGGRYITVYANAGHTYMYVDGMLYDTAGRSGVFASRWLVHSVDNSGYVVRHWPGL
jgi:cell wall-associated NlpC family hydrolase